MSGPLSSEQGRADLEELVDDARRARAPTALCGGRRPPSTAPGWFYEPTVLAGITPEMRIHHEEAFGPVATLYRVADLDEAVRARQRHPVRAQFQRVDAGRRRAATASPATWRPAASSSTG